MQIDVQITLRLEPFDRLLSQLERRDGEIYATLLDCSQIYRDFIFQRFLRYAAGGGNWKKLNAAYAALKARKGLDPRILVRDKILLETLRPNRASIIKSSDGLKMQFARGRQYPNGTAVATVLDAHNRGTRHLPKREIIVSPDAATGKKIEKRAEEGLRRVLLG